jgi:hypothetical protein
VTDPTPGLPPAGWYTDPGGLPQQRWWDGLTWTENVQPEPHPIAVPVTELEHAASAQQAPVPEIPHAITPVGPDPVVSVHVTDAATPAPAGRLHFRALLVVGLVASVAGLGLFLYGLLVVVDESLQLYGSVIAGFGAFAMLLWLAAGAIRQR